ncbi:toxin-antitoxin system HicB family antitoxin [Aurantiacibacter gilvus]|uniref:Toxin-antitoxin system HicB family antitoxin n=1 Tax=Aurantiacibacter gilvus TaxID=3139141 RepID=A0ABU9IHY0_9SPHN
MAAPKKQPANQVAKKAFALRLDPALHDAVERLAAGELRSVNAEIEVLLREALAKRGIKVPLSERPRRGRPPKEG